MEVISYSDYFLYQLYSIIFTGNIIEFQYESSTATTEPCKGRGYIIQEFQYSLGLAVTDWVWLAICIQREGSSPFQEVGSSPKLVTQGYQPFYTSRQLTKILHFKGKEESSVPEATFVFQHGTLYHRDTVNSEGHRRFTPVSTPTKAASGASHGGQPVAEQLFQNGRDPAPHRIREKYHIKSPYFLRIKVGSNQYLKCIYIYFYIISKHT